MAVIKMRPPKTGKAIALKFLIDYMINYEKTSQDLVCGKNCNPETAFDEMVLTKQLWNKTDGRQYCHFIQSFSPKDNITPALAHEIGRRLIDEFRQFNGFEIVVVTHTDKGHLHNHFAINSVNAETGLKWEQTAKDLYALKEYSNRLCHEYNLAEIALGRSRQNQSYGEWQNRRDGTSWKAALEADIRECLSYCTSKAAFFHAMNDKGIDVTWTKDRKYVTFKLPDSKKCRNSKLSDPEFFSKENMQSIIDNNRENMELFEAIPDLWLDALRLVGSTLNPSAPDYLLQAILHRDLSGLEGKALLEAIEKLKNDYETEIRRIRAAQERQQSEQQSSRAFGALVDTLELLFDEDDLEIG